MINSNNQSIIGNTNTENTNTIISTAILMAALETNSKAPKLTKALSEVQGKIRGLRKDAVGQVGGGTKVGYLSGDKLVENLIPVLSEKGILISTSVIRTYSQDRIVTTKSGEKLKYEFEGILHYQFIMGEEIVQGQYPVAGDQFDDVAKAMGTALTYSDRYFLMKYFKISTDKDDADAKDNDEGEGKTTVKKAVKVANMSNTQKLEKPVAKATTKKTVKKTIPAPREKETTNPGVSKEFDPATEIKTFISNNREIHESLLNACKLFLKNSNKTRVAQLNVDEGKALMMTLETLAKNNKEVK